MILTFMYKEYMLKFYKVSSCFQIMVWSSSIVMSVSILVRTVAMLLWVSIVRNSSRSFIHISVAVRRGADACGWGLVATHSTTIPVHPFIGTTASGNSRKRHCRLCAQLRLACSLNKT